MDFYRPMPMDCSYGNAGEENPQHDEQPWNEEVNWMSRGESKGKSQGKEPPGTMPQLWADRASSGRVPCQGEVLDMWRPMIPRR